MFEWLGKKLAARPTPIGVEIGAQTIRLAQCTRDGRDWHLAAAASADIPAELHDRPAERAIFIQKSLAELLRSGGFSGRDAALALPPGLVHVRHVRTARLSDDETRLALPWELKGKLPVDPSEAEIRHVIAGEVTPQQEPQHEVIVMASPRQAVLELVELARRAKLNVQAVHVQAKAIVDCFGHVYRRKSDAEMTNCFIDIGHDGTRVVVARANGLLFVRHVPVGAHHIHDAIAAALQISPAEARLLRSDADASAGVLTETRQATQAVLSEGDRSEPRFMVRPGISTSPETGDAVLTPQDRRRPGLSDLRRADLRPSISDAPADPAQRRARPADAFGGFVATDRAATVAGAPDAGAFDRAAPDRAATAHLTRQGSADAAAAPVIARLVDELNLCRRYHDAAFPRHPINRLIFVGGAARERSLCQQIARALGVCAQLGDPMVRMSRTMTPTIQSGIDRRLPQPGWAVAIGLSMGAVAQPVVVADRKVA